MLEIFPSTFLSIFGLFIISLFGYILFKSKVIGREGTHDLIGVIMNFTLPCLIINSFIRRFRLEEFYDKFFLAAWCIGFIFLLYFVGLLVSIGVKDVRRRNSFLGMLVCPNGGFLPLPIVTAILPQHEMLDAYIYIFIYCIGINLVTWSWGVKLLGNPNLKTSFRLPAPFLAVICGILLASISGKSIIPNFLLEIMELVGNSTIPLAMFSLGCVIGSSNPKQIGRLRLIYSLVLIKMILIPLLVLSIVFLLKFEKLLGLVLVLEAATTPAVSCLLIAERYGGDVDFVAYGTIATYISGLFTIPLSLGLFLLFS